MRLQRVIIAEFGTYPGTHQDASMVTIGVDPHKQTHTAAAVNELGVEVAHLTALTRPVANDRLLEWGPRPGLRAGVGGRGCS
jgi:hypothetical protein